MDLDKGTSAQQTFSPKPYRNPTSNLRSETQVRGLKHSPRTCQEMTQEVCPGRSLPTSHRPVPRGQLAPGPANSHSSSSSESLFQILSEPEMGSRHYAIGVRG